MGPNYKNGCNEKTFKIKIDLMEKNKIKVGINR